MPRIGRDRPSSNNSHWIGKTGYLTMLMLVVREISADETLALGKKRFPKDPAMIVVCPTKALEEDMVCTFHEVVTRAI
jgi:hypothetical protein